MIKASELQLRIDNKQSLIEAELSDILEGEWKVWELLDIYDNMENTESRVQGVGAITFSKLLNTFENDGVVIWGMPLFMTGRRR